MYYWNNFIDDINSKLKPGDTLLDAGAGDCHWRKHFPEANYIGMDLAVGDSEWDYSHLDITGDLRNIPLTKAILRGISLHIRAILAIHKPLLLYFDRFKPLQYSPTGHFVMARKL